MPLPQNMLLRLNCGMNVSDTGMSRIRKLIFEALTRIFWDYFRTSTYAAENTSTDNNQQHLKKRNESTDLKSCCWDCAAEGKCLTKESQGSVWASLASRERGGFGIRLSATETSVIDTSKTSFGVWGNSCSILPTEWSVINTKKRLWTGHYLRTSTYAAENTSRDNNKTHLKKETNPQTSKLVVETELRKESAWQNKVKDVYEQVWPHSNVGSAAEGKVLHTGK